MVVFNGVTKVYPNGTVALEGVELRIADREFVFVIGPSGSGKSTLLKLILREEDVSGGAVHMDGVNLADLRHADIPYHRRRIGTVFQDFRLLPRKTVYENVAFAMEVMEKPHREIRRAVPRVLTLVGLAARADVYPAQLSGGEQQRAALARAIVNEPPILLADEPTGNLDPVNSREIMFLLRDINARGTTVVVATHDQKVVDLLQRRVVELREGRIARDQRRGGYDTADDSFARVR